MALYICPKCGETFNDPFITGDRYEQYASCPRCGNPDFEAASECRGCLKDMEYGKLIAGEYCPDCVRRALDSPELVKEYMHLPDVKENFAEYLAERHWEPWREEVSDDE